MSTAPTIKKQRTCVSCHKKTGKDKLFRLFRDEKGYIQLDVSGKKAGRGTYVCSLVCLQSAVKSKRLERALKTTIAPCENERIVSQLSAVVKNV